MTSWPERPAADLAQVLRGFLMGGADIIPGVSGGTVALILGIYERLVTAISRFDLTFLRHVGRREWSAAAVHVDLRFLVTLGTGIALGIISLASLMHYLLEQQRPYTLAVFFGLILGSSVLVARMIPRTAGMIATVTVTTVFAFWLVGLLPAAPPEGDWYVFLCGIVAICAMILPGISGAFVLLILGKYDDITGLLRGLLHGEVTVAAIVTVTVFCLGCAVGLLVFSKFLRWLLSRHAALTMAALCGFMLGSLRKIWPFQRDLTPKLEFKRKQFENVWPQEYDTHVLLVLACALIAFAAVLALDAWQRRSAGQIRAR